MRCRSMFMWMLLALPLSGGLCALADPPSTRPTTRPFRPGFHGMTGPERRSGWPMGGSFDTLEQDWPRASRFFQENSPRRWELLFKPLEEGMRKRMVQRYLLGEYHKLQWQRNDDPDLYANGVRQIQLQDQAFDLAVQFRSASGPAREQIKALLREKVVELVEARMQERELRMARLEKLLAKERARLAADRGRQEKVIDEQLGTVLGGDLGYWGPERPERPRPPGKAPRD